MNDSKKQKLPTPQELQQIYPVTELHRNFIAKSRETIKQILNGTDPRLLLIVGPCSIHDAKAAIEYAHRLKELIADVSETFFIVMRFYTEKSRTSLGWKGILYDPDLNGTHNILEGLQLTRELLLSLAELQIPAAAELLDPFTMPYYQDLLSWACIGARTSESQTHRLMASGLTFPIGFKNNTSGSIEVAVNGALVASEPHTFIGLDENGQLGIVNTRGNPNAHVTLRGGNTASNYDPASIQHTLDCLKNAQLPQRVVIDCSHDNSRRNHFNQVAVFESILKQIIEGNPHIRGLSLESHLCQGNQQLSADPLDYAVSITDPCLDWPTTSSLVKEGQRILNKRHSEACVAGEIR